jgi:hypothetical protein
MIAIPEPNPRLPARVRFLAAAMLGAYTVLNALLVLFDPLIGHWPPYGATAAVVPPMVVAMVYAVIPLARRVSTADGCSNGMSIACRPPSGPA